jgi:ribose 5-phosphate isomerase A
MGTSSGELKRTAGRAAADLVSDGMAVGLGSGSTLVHVIRRLGERVRDGGLRITGVATSFESRSLAREMGIPLREPMDTTELDLALDGADEVDPAGHHLKGAGAAQVLEKIVASMARRYVLVVDESKLVARLGLKRPVVLDVAVPALAYVLRRISELGGEATPRTGSGKIGPVISDQGHIVVDARFDGIDDPPGLCTALDAIPGLVGHGLFVNLATAMVVARQGPGGPEAGLVEFT